MPHMFMTYQSECRHGNSQRRAAARVLGRQPRRDVIAAVRAAREETTGVFGHVFEDVAWISFGEPMVHVPTTSISIKLWNVNTSVYNVTHRSGVCVLVDLY